MSRSTFTFLRRPFARDVTIFIGFCALTAVMTWPWILHLRNAVADKGDPYMIAWTLWWDFHQAFHNPLQLFDANVFYPYRYTLAFSENDFGIALLFFPLFAIGLRPLTVHAIATFLGFAFSGYGSFRLTRTLTGSEKSAWLAGIIFAFIPYRFHLLSHLHYLFAGWLPLVCEALILFSRNASWRRATWLGVAFLMNALTCVSWFIMALAPLALTLIVLIFATRGLIWDRRFWIRGSVAMIAALLLFSPFLFAYYRVSILYGLRWQPWEFAFNSASITDWLRSDRRNKLWHNMGAAIPGAQTLFPGLLAPLLALAAFRFRKQMNGSRRAYLLLALDLIIVLAAIVAAISFGYGDLIFRVFGLQIAHFNQHSLTGAIIIMIAAGAVRIVVTLLSTLRRIRSHPSFAAVMTRLKTQSAVALAIGLIWMGWGFLASLGPNVFLNRWLLHIALFQSIRYPSRAAMICFVGLAVLGGIGAATIATKLQTILSLQKLRPLPLLLIAGAVLFELRAAPLQVERGEVDASALALRLRTTPMTGGIVELPSAGLNRHFYMLRAADHERPLVNATSSFISPITDEINRATNGKVDRSLIDLLEQIPASYLVIHKDRMSPPDEAGYERFLTRQLAAGRLRFINRFDGATDLYAVVKNEPAAKSEAPLPFETSSTEWRAKIVSDPVNLLIQVDRAQTLYRIMLTSTGTMPRYENFLPAIEELADHVDINSDEDTDVFAQNLKDFAARVAQQDSLRQLDDRSYVEKLIGNTRTRFDAQEKNNLIDSLDQKRLTRAQVLLTIANDPDFSSQQNDRSLLLLHYFGYLKRNPDDPPDRNFNGFNFWLRELSKDHDSAKIAAAFQNSIEYHVIKERQ